MADAIDALVGVGVTPRRAMLIGGAAASPAVRHVAASLFGGTVGVPTPDEYVAAGAARQAWALYGGDAPPSGNKARAQVISADPTAAVRERYRDRRAATHPTTS